MENSHTQPQQDDKHGPDTVDHDIETIPNKATLPLPSVQTVRSRNRSGGSFASSKVSPLPPIKQEEGENEESPDRSRESLDLSGDEALIWGSGRATPKHGYHWTKANSGSRTSGRRRSSVQLADLPSARARKSVSGIALTRRRMSRIRPERRRRRSSVAPSTLGGSRYSLDPQLLEKAKKKGVLLDVDGDFDVFDEITRLRQLDIIKQMPVKLAVKRKLRDKLYDFMPEDVNKGCASYWYRQKLACFRFRMRSRVNWLEFCQYTTLWNSAFKTIEGHHGSGVVTYFRFLKWLLQLNIVIFLLVFCLMVIPQAAFPYMNYTTAVTGTDDASNITNNAASCSAIYQYNVTTSMPKGSEEWTRYISDFLIGTGWMELTIAFYGFYDDRERSIMDTTYSYNLPLAYLLVVIIAIFISLVLIVKNTARGFKERLLSKEQGAGRQYCNQVYSGWDYSLTDPDTALLRHKSIYREFTSDMLEERNAVLRARRSAGQKCRMYTVRVLVNLLVCGVLGGAGYLIYYTTQATAQITSQPNFSSFPVWKQFLVEFMTSLTITALNGIVPVIFKVIVTWEHYTPATEVYLTLIRTVFLRLASLAVLLATLFGEITCGSTQDSCRINTDEDCPAIRCWETYVGQEMYKLVVMDFLVVLAMVFCYEFPRKLIVDKCGCMLVQKFGYQEFDLPKNVLDLIYAQTLLWLGMMFAPMIPAIVVIKLVIVFYLKMLTTIFNYKPGSKPIRASDSNQYFMAVLLTAYTLCLVPIIYVIWSVMHLQTLPDHMLLVSDITMLYHVTVMVTLTLSTIPVLYVITRLPPSPGCGPFRLHSYMHEILTITLKQMPDWVGSALQYLSSAAFIVPVIIILCLAIFYTVKISSAYKDMTEVLKEQLIMEGQDKHFLMNKIQELTEGGDTGNKQPAKLTEENEKQKPKNGATLPPEGDGDTQPNVPMSESSLWGDI